jgi:hypothetical protein
MRWVSCLLSALRWTRSGTVGEQFDPCYHLACDTFANNNDHALAVNADLIGFAILSMPTRRSP